MVLIVYLIILPALPKSRTPLRSPERQRGIAMATIPLRPQYRSRIQNVNRFDKFSPQRGRKKLAQCVSAGKKEEEEQRQSPIGAAQLCCWPNKVTLILSERYCAK